MPSYKIACMNRFAERLSWAMQCAGFDPNKDQSRIAELIGKPCKPQNIQHLLDPDNEVENTKYLLDLAAVLNCDPFWLGRHRGIKPTLMDAAEAHPATGSAYRNPPIERRVAPFVAMTAKPQYLWPFKRFTAQEYASLDDNLKENFEAIIFASIGNRGHPEKHEQPATYKTSA